ncbi:hypothetical protein BDV40DRAFT_212430 [Aspergillus tamarii]|uniref:Uncharacterized protein n=1 Tax=Aspergillus tamarii TaxID=41984 RepID=A0A5N6UPZ1_ASPTM|nr:hypothetical protein BDV40DRAFT_212430 [Aspergillus tamarii]
MGINPLAPYPPQKKKKLKEQNRERLKEEDLKVVEHRVRCRFSFASPSLLFHCSVIFSFLFFFILFSSFHPLWGICIVLMRFLTDDSPLVVYKYQDILLGIASLGVWVSDSTLSKKLSCEYKLD